MSGGDGARPPGGPDGQLRLIVAVVVAVVWSCSFVADVIPQLEYSPDPKIGIAMLGVVTSLFGAEAFRRWR